MQHPTRETQSADQPVNPVVDGGVHPSVDLFHGRSEAMGEPARSSNLEFSIWIISDDSLLTMVLDSLLKRTGTVNFPPTWPTRSHSLRTLFAPRCGSGSFPGRDGGNSPLGLIEFRMAPPPGLENIQPRCLLEGSSGRVHSHIGMATVHDTTPSSPLIARLSSSCAPRDRLLLDGHGANARIRVYQREQWNIYEHI
jgi:hypothetical protein